MGDAQWIYKRLPLAVKAIVNTLSADMEVTIDDLLGRSHMAAHTRARHVLYWRLRQMVLPNGKRPSVLRIGSWLSRDHSTITWGLQRHERRMATDAALREYCARFALSEARPRQSIHSTKTKIELLTYIDYLEGEIERLKRNAET